MWLVEGADVAKARHRLRPSQNRLAFIPLVLSVRLLEDGNWVFLPVGLHVARVKTHVKIFFMKFLFVHYLHSLLFFQDSRRLVERLLFTNLTHVSMELKIYGLRSHLNLENILVLHVLQTSLFHVLKEEEVGHDEEGQQESIVH